MFLFPHGIFPWLISLVVPIGGRPTSEPPRGTAVLSIGEDATWRVSCRGGLLRSLMRPQHLAPATSPLNRDGGHCHATAPGCSALPSARSNNWRIASGRDGIFLCARLQSSTSVKIWPSSWNRTVALGFIESICTRHLVGVCTRCNLQMIAAA